MVAAPVGLVPQKGIEQIAMSAVDRDAVEADRHRLAGRARIGLGDLGALHIAAQAL